MIRLGGEADNTPFPGTPLGPVCVYGFRFDKSSSQVSPALALFGVTKSARKREG